MNPFTEDDECDEPRNAHMVPDFLQANDWKFGRFATLVLTLQAIVLLLIFLDGYGLVPLYLRELVTFLFYSYVPGLLLLRALRVHNIGKTLTTLLSVALSIVLLMFVGFVLDIAFLKFSGPVPFVLPVVLSGQTIMILLLIGLAYLSDREYGSEPKFDIAPLISAPAFALYSLPLVAVLSTYVLNGWNIAALQIVLILFVAAAVMALIIVRFPAQLYPVAVVCIAMAVLFHVALMSRFPVEWADVGQEYWSANSTLIRGYWEPTAIGRTDSVLSVNIIAPVFFLICGLDLNLIFKVCYPVLFCMVPLGIFIVSAPRIGVRPAFLAAFLIISGTVFFTESLGLARQIIAEIMLVAILTTVLYDGKCFAHSATIACVLAIGLVVSHYGTLAIVGPCALIAGILYLALRGRHLDRRTIIQIVGSAAVLIIPSISWYALVSSERIMMGFRWTIRTVLDGMEDAFDPFNGLLGTIVVNQGVALTIWLMSVLQLIIIILSAYGMVIAWSSKRNRERWGMGFLIMLSIFVFLSPATLFDLNLFDSVSVDRFFHTCLLLTAPLAIYGGTQLFCVLNLKRDPARVKNASVVAVGSLLIVGLLLNTGVVSFVVSDPLPVQLDMEIEDRPRFNDGAWLGAQFTIDRSGDSGTIFADANRAYLLQMLGGKYNPFRGKTAVPVYDSTNVHYYLSSENLKQSIWLEDSNNPRLNKTKIIMDNNFKSALLQMDKLYTSQESELYFKKL